MTPTLRMQVRKYNSVAYKLLALPNKRFEWGGLEAGLASFPLNHNISQRQLWVDCCPSRQAESGQKRAFANNDPVALR